MYWPFIMQGREINRNVVIYIRFRLNFTNHHKKI